MDEQRYARRVWQLLETLHAVTYFAEECREANRAVGLRGFWMGYFGSRAAPLGPVEPAVVAATFANFHPAMVARAIPDAWTHASPAAILEARAASAAAALRRLAPAIDDVAAQVQPLLDRVVAAAPAPGRPLFAANRAVPLPQDPVARLWQTTTSLREHRGDGHVASLVAAGLRGCDIHVLFAAGTGTPVEVLRDNRGWSEEDWRRSTERLATLGFVEDGGVTPVGEQVRAGIEALTDDLAEPPYEVLSADERDGLVTALVSPARAVAASGAIPFPNPIGLPRPA